MRILLLTQYFPPEVGATQNRLTAFVRACREEHVNLTVLTAMPHYQTDRIHESYRGRWFVRERFEEIPVLRAWVWTSRHSGKWVRLFNYLSFALSSLWIGLRHAPRVDVILWDSPPLTLGATAFLLSKIKKASLVSNIADLWPESIVALGLLPDGPAARFLTRLEEFLYRNSKVISGQTNKIIEGIRARAPAQVPIILWRNGGVLQDADRAESDRWRSAWAPSARHTLVGYAGLFGIPQGLTTILDAAARLAGEDITFVMVGDGPRKAELNARAQSLRLQNIVWEQKQAHRSMPAIWSAFDCTIVCLRRIPLFRGAVPSKMFEAMAAGIPVILAVEGEAAEIIEAAAAGIVVKPEDASQLARAIGTLHADRDLRRRLGRNGQEAVRRLYNRNALTRDYVRSLNTLVREPTTRTEDHQTEID